MNVSRGLPAVPAESLENVIVSYFRIPADVLREREPFDRETEEYLWHKRDGMSILSAICHILR